MNIAMITNTYKPFVGGVPVSVERLAAGLRGRGNTVTVFAPHYPGEEPEDGVIRFRAREKALADGLVVPDMLDPTVSRTFRAMDFDLIHVHQPMVAGHMGLYLSRRYRTPLAATCHTRYEEYLHYLRPFGGLPTDGRLCRAGRGAVGLHNRLFFSRCDLVFAPTHSMAQHLRESGVPGRIDILPTGLEAGDFRPAGDRAAALRRQYLPEGGHLFCTVSRLSREKNQAFLLRTLARYGKTAESPFHLLVIGDGPERAALARLGDALGLGDRVTFTSAVPHGELPDWYGAADAFLFSSRSETQGIVLLEAMAAGLPVVAVAATGVSDVVQDRINGALCPHDEAAFARAIGDSVASRANLARMSHEAVTTAGAFRAERVAATAEGHYRDLLERGREAVPVFSAAR